MASLSLISLSTPLCVLFYACFYVLVQMIKVATRQLVGWVGEGNQLPEEEEEKGIHMLEAHISLSLPISINVEVH